MVTPGPPSTPVTCVFCELSIEPGEATAGRPPIAAHAACADAALADDEHWEAVHDAAGPDGPQSAGPQAPRRAGCLAALTLALAAAAASRIGS